MSRRGKHVTPEERREAKLRSWHKWRESERGQKYYSERANHTPLEYVETESENEENPTHLYAIWNEKGRRVKIGRSTDVARRLRELQIGNHNKLRVVKVWEKQGHLERSVHAALEIVGEWEGCREWFDTSPETAIRVVELYKNGGCTPSDGSADHPTRKGPLFVEW